jgi:hypothetical protein
VSVPISGATRGEAVASQVRGGPVAGYSPDVHHLAPGLMRRAQHKNFAIRMVTYIFCEFPPRRHERVLTGLDLALGYGPGAFASITGPLTSRLR